jgi:hypothetical protein
VLVMLSCVMAPCMTTNRQQLVDGLARGARALVPRRRLNADG